MAIAPEDFNISLYPNPMRCVIGSTADVTITFSNSSSTERGYNLTAQLVLPDGASFISSTPQPDSIVTNADYTVTITWLSIQDLAPKESTSLPVTVMADATFRSTGNTVPFDIPLTPLTFNGFIDTTPQGGPLPNIQIEKSISSSFIPLRYSLTKSAPGKMPKGAGYPAGEAPRWPFTYTLIVTNNSTVPSEVTLIDNLPNGVRYLGGLKVVPSYAPLENPSITYPNSDPSNAQDYVTLDWGSLILPSLTSYTISFAAAVWDNYTVNGIENSGSRISHGTQLINTSQLNGLSGPVEAQAQTAAMDLTIDKSRTSSSTTDVGQQISYFLTYRVNQYDDIDNTVLNDILGNGQTYNNNSTTALDNPNPPKNADGTTTLTWTLGTLTTGSDLTISFSSTVDAAYIDGSPVVAADTLVNNSNINGLNTPNSQETPDSSGVSVSIGTPSISKSINGTFYADGTPKPAGLPAAPGDLVKFTVSYDASNLTAQQKNIEVDDFAPLNMGPFPQSASEYVYGGNLAYYTGPTSVSPNGARWALGKEETDGRYVPGGTTWSVTFKILVRTTSEDLYVGARNNYAKLAGSNSPGKGYSDRDLLLVNFGKPNLNLEKTVTGPDVNAIKSGETYTYSVTVSNPISTSTPTADAFQMLLTDTVPNDLNFASNVSVTGTGSYEPPDFSFYPHISWNIIQLAPEDSLTMNFSVEVADTIASGQTLTNTAVLPQPRAQNNPDSFQYLGDPLNASVTLKAVSLTLIKQISPTIAKVGDVVTNILTLTVPEGTIAENIIVKDTFPIFLQQYVGNATQDGISVVPSVSGGLVTFPAISSVDATKNAVAIISTFETRVSGTISGQLPPYTESQANSSSVVWEIDGQPSNPVAASFNLQVNIPMLTSSKQQQNITAGGLITSSPVNYTVGDIIEYTLTVTNNGKAPAYNVIVTDTLNTFLDYVDESFVASSGTPSINGQKISWSIPFVDIGSVQTLVFRVNTLPNVVTGSTISGSFTIETYSTNNNSFGISYGPVVSNTVLLIAPNAVFTKTAQTNGRIGDLVIYTLSITIPKGTIAYNPLITDTLPSEQGYVSPPPNAVFQRVPDAPVVVSPTVSSQLVTLGTPSIPPQLDAPDGDTIYLFTFPARITSVTSASSFTQVQTDNGKFQWASTLGGTRVLSKTTRRNITATKPSLNITKQQSINSADSFTVASLPVSPGDSVYYQLTLQSNGASPAYNIALNDIFSNDLIFDTVYYGPTAGNVIPPQQGTAGGTITWNIPELENGSSAVVILKLTAVSPLSSSGKITNKVSDTKYYSNDGQDGSIPTEYTAQSNETILNIPSLTITKTATPAVYQIGEIVTYNITVAVQDGISAYNLVLNDCLPIMQQYVSGTFTSSLPGTLNDTDPNNLSYTFSSSPITGPVNITARFDAAIIDGLTVPPYSMTQSNCSGIQWNTSEGGPPAPIVTTSSSIEVIAPKLTVLKEQRVSTEPSAPYSTAPLTDMSVGDTIDYRLTVTNIGLGTAYNVITTDVLDTTLTYINTLGTVIGSVTITPLPPSSGNTITWDLGTNAIAAGSSASLQFTVQITGGSFENTKNNASGNYSSSNGPKKLPLGPEVSIDVGFNQVPPLLDKASENISESQLPEQNETTGLVGDIIQYTVTIAVPLGNKAYNLVLTDTLPDGQSYTGPATLNGTTVMPVVSLQNIIFPEIPVVDATAQTVTLVYVFNVKLDSFKGQMYEIQTDETILTWNKSEGSSPGTPVTAENNIFVSEGVLALTKQQKLSQDGNFTAEPIDIASGNTVVYSFTITNTSNSTIYNVTAWEHLGNLYQYINAPTPPRGIIAHDGSLSGGKVQWIIPMLNAGESLTAQFNVLVLAGGNVNETIPNSYIAAYSYEIDTPIFGTQASNTVEADFPGLELIKAVNPTSAAVGEILTYTITVTVPKGLTAYNVMVEDTVNSSQMYIGNASVDGNPVIISPVTNPLAFPAQTFTAGPDSDRAIPFCFNARILDGNNDPFLNPVIPISPVPGPPPQYQESQTDTAQVQWQENTEGPILGPVEGSTDIVVSRPYIWTSIKQNNVTKGTGFLSTPLSIENGDTLQFKLTAYNYGSSAAFNTIVKDALSSILTYSSIVEVTSGNAMYDNVSGTMIWTIDQIAENSSAYLIFEAIVTGPLPLGSSSENTGSFSYDSSSSSPVAYNGITNTLTQIYPLAEISKASNSTSLGIGSKTIFTIAVVIPANTTAYNLQLKDTLPSGFEYMGNPQLNGQPIEGVIISGPIVTFPEILQLGPQSEATILTYTFDSTVISAEAAGSITVYNTAEIVWSFDPLGPPQGNTSILPVWVTNSQITIAVKQRNSTLGGAFTDSPIKAASKDIIEYELTITNLGPNNVYDVLTSITLMDALYFIAPVSVPVGTLTHSGGSSDGTVAWAVPQLQTGETLSAIFSVRIAQTFQGEVPLDGTLSFADGSDPVTARRYDNIFSNTVIADVAIRPSRGVSLKKLKWITEQIRP